MDEDLRGSRISGFYKLTIEERVVELNRRVAFSTEEFSALNGTAGLTVEQADHMIENVIGLHSLPLGIALNFQINGRDVLVPMAIEEPSVVAGASFMAKLARSGGGFIAHATPSEMIAQIQILEVVNPPAARLA